MDVRELPQLLKQRGASGVIVASVDPEGMAAEAGIEKGDIIVSINRRAVTDIAGFRQALQAADKTGSITILARRGGMSIYFALRTGGRR